MRWRLVLALFVVTAVISAGWSASSIGFESDRSNLVDPALAWQQRYREFKERFPRWDDAVIVCEPRAGASLDDALAFFRSLDAVLAQAGGYPERSLWIDPNEASPSAMLLLDEAELEGVVATLRRAGPIVIGPGTLDSALVGAAFTPGAEQDLRRLVDGIARVIDGDDSVLGLSAEPLVPITTDSGALALGFVSLNDAQAERSVDGLAPAIAGLRAHIRTALEQSGTGDLLDVGVTGVPVLESDETQQSTRDAALASAFSLTLIGVLLLAVYRNPVVPILALVALLIGVAWSFGWVTLAVGHLQVLSVVFAVFLLGLGVDSAIHIVARLELVHPDHEALPDAICNAVAGVGPGIVTGAITTAVAFAATALSPFTGVAEMGLIAAGGVVLCTIAVLFGLPALLMALPRPERFLRARAGGTDRPFAGRVGKALDARPRTVLGVALIVTLGAGLSAAGVIGGPVRYDPDLTSLMPPDAESVRWEERLAADDERSAWHAVVLANTRAEGQRLTSALSALGAVESVSAAGVLFPEQGVFDRKRELLQTLPAVPRPGAVRAPTDDEVQRLRQALARLGITDSPVAQNASALASASTESLRAVLRAFARDRSDLAQRFRDLRAVRAPDLDDLPDAVRTQMALEGGGYLLRVYPAAAGDLGPLDPGRLAPFVESVLSVAPGATGPSVQVHESTSVILDGYRRAAIYAAVAILALLLVDFRSLADALCAVLPVGVGLVLLVGFMAVLDVPLNFANTIVMPLIIGLGVDAGVHAVHRWRTQPAGAPAGLAGGTGRAITLTSATTAIGFGCMAIAEHRGVQSLGIVMAAGLALTWAASVFVLPAVLRLRTRA